MTRETKTTISPSDIIAVEFECLECGIRITQTVAEFKEPFGECPHCRNKWVPTIGGPAYLALRDLIRKIRDFSEKASDSDLKLGVSVRFQLQQDKAEI